MSAAAKAKLTYIIGHKNPDVDAICSAIAYAALQQARGETGFITARCGNSNARIDAILARFNQPLPLYLADVTPRVRDVMVTDVVSLAPNATCAEALELIDRHDVRILPVVTPENTVIGSVSVFDLGGYFVPKMREPRAMRRVCTSLNQIAHALGGRILHLERADLEEELFIRIGAMDVRSFWKVSQDEGVPASKSIIIVGDRWDIQQRSLQIGVRAIITTGNLPVDQEVVALARTRGVSVIVSPYDTATTAWVVRAASTVGGLIDRKYASVSPDLRLTELRRKLATSSAAAYFVLEDDGKLLGIVTKTDVLKPVRTHLVLVDHNEMSQAVPGADQVEIAAVIDHHRLGSLHTQQPILFINEPVGSTCTIIADLFRREGREPSPDIAGIMMSGIISDTLHLNSPTTTEKDALLLAWLSRLAQVNSKSLADDIFSSGSVILSMDAAAAIRNDFKIYEEDDARFAVSQVEELGFGNFWQHARNFSVALEKLCRDESLTFAAVLVTDINTQNSLLLLNGAAEVIARINYSAIQGDEIFDLPGVVSRKKQLIPYFTSLLKEITSDGIPLEPLTAKATR